MNPNDTTLIVGNEFARVAVSLDTAANEPRLRLEDLRSGRRILLDALEVASLTFLSHADFEALVDPGKHGWQQWP